MNDSQKNRATWRDKNHRLLPALHVKFSFIQIPLMKNKSTSQSAFFSLRVLIALFIFLAGVFLVVLGFGAFSGASTQVKVSASTSSRLFSGGPNQTILLEQVASGLTQPIAVAHAGDSSGRLFIVQQTGEIRILSGGTLLPTPFLDLSALVSCCGEQGLLGLAFHPDYATNGFFYVDYTNLAGDTVVARYNVSAANPNVADPNSAQTVLTQNQPFANHNGGQLAFGPDGYLYIALGDGGSGGDPQDNGQNLETWLGKILRVDVNGDDFPGDPNRNYAVPPDNPFVGSAGLDEIWAYGLRNPWRITFDRATGDLFIADVGQSAWEEINFQLAASGGGENYGWNVLEGMHCFQDEPPGICNVFLNGGSTLPVLEYNHSLGCSVTGGYRYRGQLYPQIEGIYFYADYCSGRIWGALPRDNGTWESQELLIAGFQITSFGEDEAGELYVVQYGGAGEGALHRIVGCPTPNTDFNHDGKPDYVLHNGGTRQTAVWYMNNNVRVGGAYGPILPVGWRVADVADFNGDGEPDYALFAPSTRQTAIWYLSGGAFVSSAYGPTLPSGWELVAAGKFNGDCQPDYVLYNASTRRTAVWYLNNNVYAGGAYGPTLPAGWRLAGVADFNRNGKTDYLLFNPVTRQSAIWYLSGTAFVSGAYGPTIGTGYGLTGVADFNGDSKPDYVLYNFSTRRTALYYLNNNVYTGSAFGPILPAGWNLVAP
jgi:glucose/arabinose dehydrogenase